MIIPLNQIAILHRQRKSMDPVKLQELCDSIVARGRLIHPINVRPRRPDDLDDDGQPITEPWVLLTGGRRYAAHLKLQHIDPLWATIEARNYNDLDPLEQRLVELDENIKREDISWADQEAARAEYHTIRQQINPAQRMEDTAREIGVNVAQVSRALSLTEAVKKNPELAKATSAASARRKIDYEAHVQQRIATASAAPISGLRGRIRTADARDFIRAIPDASVDLVFTDLPYGVGYDDSSYGRDESTMRGKYDDSAETTNDLLYDLIPQIARVVKHTGWIVLFTGRTNYDLVARLLQSSCATHGEYGNYYWDDDAEKFVYPTACLAKEKGDKPCRFLAPEVPEWIWYRERSANWGHFPELHASNRFEPILVANGGEAKLAKKPVTNVLAYDPVPSRDRDHIMQKPHELCREIIERCSVVGEKVLDLCFGSGAHLAAAEDCGRKGIGCDSNPEQLEKAIALVSQYAHRKEA